MGSKEAMLDFMKKNPELDDVLGRIVVHCPTDIVLYEVVSILEELNLHCLAEGIYFIANRGRRKYGEGLCLRMNGNYSSGMFYIDSGHKIISDIEDFRNEITLAVMSTGYIESLHDQYDTYTVNSFLADFN